MHEKELKRMSNTKKLNAFPQHKSDFEMEGGAWACSPFLPLGRNVARSVTMRGSHLF